MRKNYSGSLGLLYRKLSREIKWSLEAISVRFLSTPTILPDILLQEEEPNGRGRMAKGMLLRARG